VINAWATLNYWPPKSMPVPRSTSAVAKGYAGKNIITTYFLLYQMTQIGPNFLLLATKITSNIFMLLGRLVYVFHVIRK